MKIESNPTRKEILKSWKYIESLGKSVLLALLISLGVSETMNAQTKDKGQDKKIKSELIAKTHTIGLKIYEDLVKKEPIPIGFDGTSFNNTDINEEVYFKRGYTKSYLDRKENGKNIIYVDESGDGQLDRIILNEEEFKSKEEKEVTLFPLTLNEAFVENKLEFSKFGEEFQKKIQVFIFKDIDTKPRFIVYDFNDGKYGETNAENVYELWLEYQKKYTEALENFSTKMSR